MADLAQLGAVALRMDISKDEDIVAAVNTITERSGGVDVLVNNAGYGLYGPVEEIEERVRLYCETMGPGGGYVLGSSTSIMEGIPPENFVAMTRAAHKYGRYGALGRAE